MSKKVVVSETFYSDVSTPFSFIILNSSHVQSCSSYNCKFNNENACVRKSSRTVSCRYLRGGFEPGLQLVGSQAWATRLF